MKQRRDLLILISLFLILVVFTILGPGRSRNDTLSSKPTTHSSAPGGALALLQWTQTLGFDAQRLQYTDFALDDATDALFMLNLSEPVNRTHSEIVLHWVENGGVLVLVEDRTQIFQGNTLLRDLDVQIQFSEETDGDIERAPVIHPVLNAPPVAEVLVRTDQVLTTERNDVAHLIGLPYAVPSADVPSTGSGTDSVDVPSAGSGTDSKETQAIISGIKHGQGYIYISSASFPFTNDGLRDADNSALLLNILRRVPEGGHILFDEIHHGFFTPPSLRSIMLKNPWGQAIIYALSVLAFYLILTGRRFGKPVPYREEIAMRSSAEYVESMSELFQRGGKAPFILQHYYTAFKRRLAKPYGINPNQDDDAFVAELARSCEVDAARLKALLARMRKKNIKDDELVRVVAESETFTVQP